MILFQWTGFAPKGIVPREGHAHRIQVSCAACFPSAAAFLRAVDSKRGRMAYVSAHELTGDEALANEGACLAIENPGTIYWRDDLRHESRHAPWIVHTQPEIS